VTILHRSPFENLEVPTPAVPMDAGARERWVKPFYMAMPDNLSSVEAALRPLLPEVTSDLITTLLVEFNWRPRTVGAFFVALDRRSDFEDLVGRLLLRSDVCYAGQSYCLALARLNTDAIWAERDRKLEAARDQRRLRHAAARGEAAQPVLQ
jgi:hypothetical protein